MQKKLLTGQNIDSQVITLDLGVVQKGDDTGILGFSIVVAAVNVLLSLAGVFGDMDVVAAVILFTSEGGCSDGSGEEENSERLDGDHSD